MLLGGCVATNVLDTGAESDTVTGDSTADTNVATGSASADESTTAAVSSSDGADSETEGGTTDGGTTDTDATGGSTGEPAIECISDADCGTDVCALYTDVEDNKDGVCVGVPAGGATRFTGTVFDLVTRAAVPNAQFQVSAALQVATNPTGAMAIVSQEADAAGRFDVTSDEAVAAQIGVLGLASLGGYYLTATALAAPDNVGAYAPTNAIHDQWIVPESDLSDWSDELALKEARSQSPPRSAV